ncbi:MAG: SoxR reducing system RseC family protein [Sedimentibacter sp.]|uniref:SoxR reducing system RseC family protein n=1 Tax=Sedimentibacter sp. TaxID=1960295 RepID=UPI0029825A93|nr:SoxR reducing system RseC family protein [Sedimentibacter sp.]MDW5299920.1 SoxR reducing system RseC family protein [Sedimentibacter sp.]
MDQVGKIEKINGNKATISVRRSGTCKRSCSNCSESSKVNGVIFETDITSDYNVGDYVEITTENEVVFKQIFVLYGVPFLLMMATIGIVQLLLDSPNKDMISAVASLASLAVSYFILKAYDKSEMKKNTLKFTVGKKLYR